MPSLRMQGGQVFYNSRSIFCFSFFRDCISYTAHTLALSPRHSHSFVLNSCSLSWQRRNNPHGVSSLISCSAHICRSPARLMTPNNIHGYFFAVTGHYYITLQIGAVYLHSCTFQPVERFGVRMSV